MTIYYPYVFSEWTVEYKPFMRKPRTAKRFIMTNLVKGETHFVDYRLPMKEIEHFPSMGMLPQKWSIDDAAEASYEFLRRYYIHNIRSWKVPVIESVYSQLLYLPYDIFCKEQKGKKQLFLYEYMSESSDVVEKYEEIQTYITLRGGVCS